MAPTQVFITGITGYIGSTTLDLLLNKETTASRYKFRALVRSPEKAEKDIRPLGVEPVIGSLDDAELLTREASNADVVLSFADADHLASVQAILKGLQHRPRPANGRKRPILIHTSGTGVLLDTVHGSVAGETIYHDNDLALLLTLGPKQPHRNVDLEIISPSLIGHVDTYIVAPPTIWGFGTGPGNHNSIQIPRHIAASLKNKQAVQIGEGLNYWSKVHVIDLAHLYISLLERALEEPQDDSESHPDRKPLPKNEDAYYFAQEGDDFTYGEVAQEIAKVLKNIGVNDSGLVLATSKEDELKYWPAGSGFLLGGNSRSRAVKARELLGWEPMYTDFKAYIAEEIYRQRRDLRR
ncbi:hypothetical protein BGZ80_001726 [Entomortierella chlamydospora]|uniref:NAD(P)-binding domain-containing protein n=1 Tax=Entomortierella chlamydospora TaxID=101097 RepID=A0A9P6T4M9_9FUNG|nr:hypothetical protein BGZ80_001726 [Entomortierella chlamydospora]